MGFLSGSSSVVRFHAEPPRKLDRAALCDALNRRAITRGERRWELSLDGGLLTYDSLRCPPLGERDATFRDDPRAAFENDLFLRLADIEDVTGVLDRLFATFCEIRVSPRWATETLPALRAWVADLG